MAEDPSSPTEPQPHTGAQPPPVPAQDPYAPRQPSSALPLQRQPSSGERMLLPVGRSPLAIIAGYLGLISMIPIFAPFALIFGILAVRDIRKSAGTAQPKHGMGRAIFALIMGALFSILLVIILIAAATSK